MFCVDPNAWQDKEREVEHRDVALARELGDAGVCYYPMQVTAAHHCPLNYNILILCK